MLSYLLTSVPTSERLNYCINELDKFSIQPEIILAPELEDGKESCFFGHISILERFIKSGENRCLILEDDCLIKENINWKLIESTDFDIFLLGGIPYEKLNENETFYFLKKFLQTHCFILTRESAIIALEKSKFLKKIPHIDHFYSEIFTDIKCLKNTIAVQNYNFQSKIIKKA